jgi:hypothetical protein
MKITIQMKNGEKLIIFGRYVRGFMLMLGGIVGNM